MIFNRLYVVAMMMMVVVVVVAVYFPFFFSFFLLLPQQDHANQRIIEPKLFELKICGMMIFGLDKSNNNNCLCIFVVTWKKDAHSMIGGKSIRTCYCVYFIAPWTKTLSTQLSQSLSVYIYTFSHCVSLCKQSINSTLCPSILSQLFVFFSF